MGKEDFKDYCRKNDTKSPAKGLNAACLLSSVSLSSSTKQWKLSLILRTYVAASKPEPWPFALDSVGKPGNKEGNLVIGVFVQIHSVHRKYNLIFVGAISPSLQWVRLDLPVMNEQPFNTWSLG